MKKLGGRHDIEQFKEALLCELNKRTGETARASVHEVIKNNGVIIEGIYLGDNSSGIKPFFYISDLYQQYCMGESFDTIIENILEKPKCDSKGLDIIISKYKDVGYIKKNVMFKLINYNENIQQLSTMPHRKFLDLAIVYYCMFDCISNSNGSVLVNDVHMKMWNLDEEALYNFAMNNTRIKNKAMLTDMRSMLMLLLKDRQISELPQCFYCDDEQTDLYVLTNESKTFGAGVILYDNLIKKYAEEKYSDFYIIPSSIHEVLLIPVQQKEEINIAELACIVREVNDTQVLEEEILSYNVYYYDREKDVISVVTTAGR